MSNVPAGGHSVAGQICKWLEQSVRDSCTLLTRVLAAADGAHGASPGRMATDWRSLSTQFGQRIPLMDKPASRSISCP